MGAKGQVYNSSHIITLSRERKRKRKREREGRGRERKRERGEETGVCVGGGGLFFMR